jgi:hypothetical protein
MDKTEENRILNSINGDIHVIGKTSGQYIYYKAFDNGTYEIYIPPKCTVVAKNLEWMQGFIAGMKEVFLLEKI